MGNSWFQFQQFRVEQDRCAMKISTDAVLLGSLAQSKSPKQILDIGTGTGVIALMLAQRFPEAQVTALEIDPEAAAQAKENFKESPFADQLKLKPTALQEFSADISFDLIVSNPPYFPDHLKSRDSKRNLALHTDSLSFEALLRHASQLLAPSGQFWVILPPRQMGDFCKLAEKVLLFLNSKIQIQDTPSKPVHREIVSFSKSKNLPSIPTRVYSLKETDGTSTIDYQQLIAGFLLKF
ncbi:MAG: methyltransferase [Bacteroidetes bacterium]|nr:methyltransferase [Bacteroidota bacterium]MDA1267681.1 methyltransferase [Bacteroidota bacterium]